MIKEYIEKIISNGKQEDMECLEEMLTEIIKDFKYDNKEKYKKYKMKLYSMANGYTIDDDMRESIIDKIGEHWTINETEEIKNQYGYSIDKNDFNVVMNMAYSDYKDVFNDDTDLYAKFSNAFINDNDAVKGKILYYFNTIIK